MRSLSSAVMAVLLLSGCMTAVPSPGPASPSPTASQPTRTDAPSPSAPRLDGRIAFMHHDADGFWQVWVACADLAEQHQLTRNAGRNSGYPAWSPDASRIAFDSDRDDPDLTDDQEISDIYTMSPDGQDVRKLTDSTGMATDAAYSPDGTLIAFGGGVPGDSATAGIYVMDAAGGGSPRRVTTIPAGYDRDWAPRFSPDGTQLLFTRDKAREKAPSQRFIVHLDDTLLRELEMPGISTTEEADWSPDGSMIVFDGDAPGYPYGGVWRIDADGGGLISLVSNSRTPDGWTNGYADPVWSPDGTLIMLLHGLHKGDVHRAGLAVMRPDGTGLAWVGDGSGEEHEPDWTAAPCR
jgi:Tol biopolymer transport system component